MRSRNGIVFSAALFSLALVCHPAIGADSDDDRTATHAITVDANGDDTASIPDFDGDGTIGFGDFVIFAGVFGASQGDEKYDATYDLNGDGEIGFSDFVIFAQNFGRDAPSLVVSIPDANLRAAIEDALGKDSGAPITQAEMATLDSLEASDANISALTGLEPAANLTYLSLNDNDITDISALSELTILERLWLSNNGIEDISALAKLSNLTELWLWNNQIEDISALSGLTGLTQLSLGRNNITDISALSGLTNLTVLILESNRISDLSPLAANKGLDKGDRVSLDHNPLDIASSSTKIPLLRARGVNVSFDAVRAINEPKIYNDNVFVLPVEENLAASWTNSSSPPMKDYTARFYEYFNDAFDFLIFFANVDRDDDLESGAFDGGFYSGVKNDVQGIGVDTFSNNSSWGSAGKLQGVIFFSIYEPWHPKFGYSDFRGLLSHELMHRWANFIVPTNFGSHWGPSSPGGELGDDMTNIIEDHGNGTYTFARLPSEPRFSPIELYLAGFIPPEDVADFQIAEDARVTKWGSAKDDNGNKFTTTTITTSGIKTYTIDDIIAEHGPRVPDHLQSQKDFRAAVILLVSEDYTATREILESVSDDALWYSHVGEDDLEKHGRLLSNFYEVTGGRGTITMDGLSQFQRRAEAKIVAPRSFGTPPPPIVDYWDTGNGHEDADRTSMHVPAEAEQQ